MAVLARLSTNTGRVHRKDPFWQGRRKQFVIAAVSTFILLQLLFLGNLSYLYGSLFRVSSRTHNINILMVDYDSGIIGESLRVAGRSLQASTFPSIQEHDNNNYQSPDDIYQAVRRGDYWAAIYANEDASSRLADAIQGGPAASSYNTTPALTYVFNEIHYVTIQDGTIVSNLQKLIAATGSVYHKMNGTAAMQSLSTDNPAAAQALFNPVQARAINIMPTTQGPRVFYNTVSIVLPIILQFFFLMAINGISSSMQFYSHLPVRSNGFIRLSLSLSYTFVGALCMTGYIWAFREDWGVNGSQFVLTWITLWLYMHINFLVLDVATGFIPMSFLSFFVITWVILSVTSTVFPFELNPGFYRLGYALPAHETWSVLMTVWSGGANNTLHIALPILFTWEVVGMVLATIALHYRCGVAAKAYRLEEEKSDERAQAKLEQFVRISDSDRISHQDEELAAGRLEETVQPRAEYYPSAPTPFEGTIERLATVGRAV